MSMKDLNVIIRELIDKEIETIIGRVKEDTKDLILTIDKKIEELRQYLKT
ncbi:hypothetical protein ODS41_09450 [Pyrobaculum sp. 3827-6]|nr:hypothetical protein [Pyrobaculum sp. 3827-6]MCU7788133.1 hypothetical protein [Pyrobaculum sp. 3827-6]